jgi:hypothetical protein
MRKKKKVHGKQLYLVGEVVVIFEGGAIVIIAVKTQTCSHFSGLILDNFQLTRSLRYHGPHSDQGCNHVSICNKMYSLI